MENENKHKIQKKPFSKLAELNRRNKKSSITSQLLINFLKIMSNNPKVRKQGGVAQWGLKVAELIRYKTPNNLLYKKYKVDDIPVEILQNPNGKNKEKAVFQMHGGAYIYKLSDTYRKTAVLYNNLSDGATVFNIDYKTGPKYQFPAALLDAVKVYNHILSLGYKQENIIFAGDSAGGNLAIELLLHLRQNNQKMPAGLICMSPWLDLAGRGQSYEYNAYNDPLFCVPKGETKQSHRKYLMKTLIRPYSQGTKLDNKMLSPVYNTFENFPKTLIQVSDNEILYSDSETFYKKLIASGSIAKFSVYHAMFHAFPVVNNTPEAKDAWNEVKSFIFDIFN